jgi:hypothetical protein
VRGFGVGGFGEEGIEVDTAEGNGSSVVSGWSIDAVVVSCRGREVGREGRVFAGDEDDGEELGDKNAGDPMVDRGVG